MHDASVQHVYVDQDIGSKVVQMDKCFHISMQGYNQYSISVVIEYQFSLRMLYHQTATNSTSFLEIIFHGKRVFAGGQFNKCNV